MRILIVDSSVRIMERLKELLIESAIITAIDTAATYLSAAALFKQNRPDIVILDIYLTGQDSISLLKEIKRSGFQAAVIILFAQPDHYIQEQYRLLGADFFFDKYHDFEKIPGLIHSLSSERPKAY